MEDESTREDAIAVMMAKRETNSIWRTSTASWSSSIQRAKPEWRRSASSRRLARDKVVKLKDAVAVTKTEKGKIKLHQTNDDSVGKGFIKGGFIGILFAALFGPAGWIVLGATAGAALRRSIVASRTSSSRSWDRTCPRPSRPSRSSSSMPIGRRPSSA